MRHKAAKRQLGRRRHQRDQLMRSLSTGLLEHGSIVTTETKAKELRMFIEPLITEARKELTLHRRRALLSKLGQENSLSALIDIAKNNAKRDGGYTRISQVGSCQGNGASMVRIDFIEQEVASK
jgi:large subunit ribosomal protein L17